MGEASKEYCGDCVDHYYSILFGEQKRSFATDLLLYPVKTSENLVYWFFKGV